MDAGTQWVVFALGRQRFALPLQNVLRVLPAVEATPVPGAPAAIAGLFELQGAAIPVLDPRHRSAHAIGVSDQFVLVRTPYRTLALWVDQVFGVTEQPAARLPAATPGLEPFQGTTRVDDELVLIHDVEKFLSPQEAQAFEQALEALP